MPFAPQEVVETQATCGLQIIIEELAHALLLEFCHPRNQRQAHRPMSSSSTISQASDTFAAMTDDHRLAEFIREQASAMRVVIQARKRLSGGAIQENWLLDLLIEGCCAAMRFPRYPPASTARRSSLCCRWRIRQA